jgi:hypothetical protein
MTTSASVNDQPDDAARAVEPANVRTSRERMLDRALIRDYRASRVVNVVRLSQAFDRLLTAADLECEALEEAVRVAIDMAEPLVGMLRDSGVDHLLNTVLDDLRDALDAPPQAVTASQSPSGLRPSVAPEGKDYPALNQCDGCVHGDPVRDGMHQDAEGRSYMMCQADKYAPTAAIDAPTQAQQDAHPPSASPQSAPEGKDDHEELATIIAKSYGLIAGRPNKDERDAADAIIAAGFRRPDL